MYTERSYILKQKESIKTSRLLGAKFFTVFTVEPLELFYKKKLFLKISQYSQEILVLENLFNKVDLQHYQKKTPTQVFTGEYS